MDNAVPWVFGLVARRSNDTAHAAVLSVADELDDGVGFATGLWRGTELRNGGATQRSGVKVTVG